MITKANAPLVRLAFFLVFFTVWEVAGRSEIIDLRWFSLPSLIGSRLIHDSVDGSFLVDAFVTTLEAVVGFIAGVVSGVAFGIALGFMTRLREILLPYLQALYAIPRPALAPLFVLWFGIGFLSKIILIVTLVYFVLVTYVIVGIQSLNQNHLRLAQTIGASRWQLFLKIIIPSVLPSIFAGMKLAMGLAIIGAVVGEFVSSNAGLGHYILKASFEGDTTGIYTGLAGLGIISLTLVLIMESIDRRFFSWRANIKI